MDERSRLIAQRASSQDSTRPSDRLALGSAVVGGLLVGVVLAARVVFSGSQTPSSSGEPPHVQAGYQPPAAAGAAAAPSAVSQLSPTPTPSAPASERLRVAHTDGQGVVLRASARDDDWTPRGFMDGDWVTVLERRGADWARVRGDNGQEGWVPARYLSS